MMICILGWKQIICELDSQLVVHMLNEQQYLDDAN